MISKIPFVDLQTQYQCIQTEIDAAITSVIKHAAFVYGPEIEAFEHDFAAFCDVKACAAVGNGTDAIHLALRALGIGQGDEVITVAHTFIATAEAISHCGARPVFVDIHADTMLINPEQLEAAITRQTKAIIPVHLYGQACDMDAVLGVARRHGIKIVEDAAQAHGARWRGRRVGSFGDIGCFSFFPGKNLGAFGDAGAVVSNDLKLIDTVRMLASHGRYTKYTHSQIGFNSRLDSLQAAILRAKLPHLEDWNAARRCIATEYLKLLAELGTGLPVIRPECDPVWHLFVIKVDDRDRLQAFLKNEGIDTGIHYPVPLHRQPAYAHLGIVAGNLPITEVVAKQVISLPMYPELTLEQARRVADTVLAGASITA